MGPAFAGIVNWELKTENFKLAGGVWRNASQMLSVGLGYCAVRGESGALHTECADHYAGAHAPHFK